jgi:hypothetical protein
MTNLSTKSVKLAILLGQREYVLHTSSFPGPTQDIYVEWFDGATALLFGEPFISALFGNKSAKRLSFKMGQLSEDNIHSLARALPTNHGIVQLSFQNLEVTDETWILLFRSLSTYPRIEVVALGKGWLRLSAESMTTRMHTILEILHLNTVVHTIELPDAFETEELYQNSILPRLEMNRSCFEVQPRTVKRGDPCIRPQLLGRALHVVRHNPNLVFRFILENFLAFVRTEEEEDLLSLLWSKTLLLFLFLDRSASRYLNALSDTYAAICRLTARLFTTLSG